ncbi:MAG: GTP-binding protein [Cyanobacteria bacterium CRU_2_1]|nr:GTP-binding protein [Cyanobacteria bacterium CRU_2_1]
MIGDFGVGKTSLIRRFVDRQFSDHYLSTVGVKISRKVIEFKKQNQAEMLNLQLIIWDIEGSAKFKAIVPSYLKGAIGAIIVGDLTRQETINHLTDHIQLFLSINSKASIVVAFNKSDLIESEQSNLLFQLNFLTRHKQVSAAYLTSAKTGKNVDRIFHTLAHQIIKPE